MPALLGIRHPRRPRRPAAHGSARHGAPCPVRGAAAGAGRPRAHDRSSRCGRTQPALAPGRFAAVAGELARLGHQVVVTGSAAERPLAMDVARRAGLPPQSVLAGRTSLAALAALTASARLVVSGDTGLAHLATAYARPSVVLFGPVPPAEWGPPSRPAPPGAVGRRRRLPGRPARPPHRPGPGRHPGSATCSAPRSGPWRPAAVPQSRPTLTSEVAEPIHPRGSGLLIVVTHRTRDRRRETTDDGCSGAAGG